MENECNFLNPYFDIIIVVNKKIFVISSDGIVYEKEEYANDDDLLLTYKQHKKEFKDFELKLVDVIKQCNIVNESLNNDGMYLDSDKNLSRVIIPLIGDDEIERVVKYLNNK